MSSERYRVHDLATVLNEVAQSCREIRDEDSFSTSLNDDLRVLTQEMATWISIPMKQGQNISYNGRFYTRYRDGLLVKTGNENQHSLYDLRSDSAMPVEVLLQFAADVPDLLKKVGLQPIPANAAA